MYTVVHCCEFLTYELDMVLESHFAKLLCTHMMDLSRVCSESFDSGHWRANARATMGRVDKLPGVRCLSKLGSYALVIVLQGNVIDKTVLTVVFPVVTENCGVRNLNIT